MFKLIFQKLKQYTQIVILILLSFAIFLFLYWVKLFNLEDLWLNLAANSFFLLFTLLIIDVLLEMRNNREWRKVNEIAKSDLQKLGNMLISYTLGQLGFSVITKLSDTLVTPTQDKAAKLLIELLGEAKRSDLLSKMHSLNSDEWVVLFSNYTTIQNQLQELISLYIKLLPPKLLSPLLNVRRALNEYMFIFNLIHEYLVLPRSKWPQVKGGSEAMESLRELQLEQLEEKFKDYLDAVEEFVSTVNKET